MRKQFVCIQTDNYKRPDSCIAQTTPWPGHWTLFED